MQQYALELILKRKIFTARTEGHDHIALRDVTLQLPPGQFSCLIGPSGCGKSTLLNIINGLDPQFEGTLKLAQDAAPARVATLFQTPRLMPWLTVLENVLLVLPAGADSRQRAVELLNQMGLEAVLNAYPSRLSGGMQRRVALARAFAIRPQILLLDEPFVSLDMPVANRLRELLLDMWQQHDSTVLFVTHDLREALALGNLALSAELLGRPYCIHGRVAHGDQLGRTINYPTANIRLLRDKAPVSGVFAVRLHGLDTPALPGVANIGKRPTVNGVDSRLEVHLFDFETDIYGRQVAVELVQKIRDEQKFASLDALKAQIRHDAEQARHILQQLAETGSSVQQQEAGSC